MMWFVLICVFLYVGPARADVTVRNFDGGGTAMVNQVSRHDLNGDTITAHEGGSIVQVGSTFYEYGQDESCGDLIGTTSAWCGVSVYSTTDFIQRTNLGHLFDPSGFQSRCAQVTGVADKSCFIPQCVYNGSNYACWVYNEGTDPFTLNTFIVFLCSQPFSTPVTIGTNCTQQADATFPQGAAHAPTIFKDGSGNCFAAYTDLTASAYKVLVIALNSTCTNTTGSSTDTGAVGEAIGAFVKSGTTYIIYGSTGCGYCSNADTKYVSASSPLGMYSGATTLSTGSCGGAPRNVVVFTANSITTYLLTMDQWSVQPPGPAASGLANQGLANHLYIPLSFSGSNISAITCSATVTIQGLTAAANPPAIFATDQTSATDQTIFYDNCDITSTVFRYFTFVPSQTNLASLVMPIGQNQRTCNLSVDCSGAVNNGNLLIDLYTAPGDALTTLIATLTLPASQFKWSTVMRFLVWNQTVTAGSKYAFLFRGSNTQGCFTLPLYLGASSNPYPAGVEKVSTNSGGSYTTETNRMIWFTTTSALPRGKGRLFGR